jgi:hypothetical protein
MPPPPVNIWVIGVLTVILITAAVNVNVTIIATLTVIAIIVTAITVIVTRAAATTIVGAMTKTGTLMVATRAIGVIVAARLRLAVDAIRRTIDVARVIPGAPRLGRQARGRRRGIMKAAPIRLPLER